MATPSVTSAQSGAVGPLQSRPGNFEEEEAEIAKAKKNQSAWVLGSAVLRITKFCAPKCLDFERVQVSKEEKACLDNCVRSFHNVNESAMLFFRDFEADQKKKQQQLILDLQDEVKNDKANVAKERKEQRRRTSGYVRM